MRGQPTTFWGKLGDEADETPAWHPLVDHCADVAACCEVLLQRTLLGKRLAYLAGQSELTRVQVARLSTLAAFHDFGKYNLGFQARADPPGNKRRLVAGHVVEAVVLFRDCYEARDRVIEALDLERVQAWGVAENGLELLLAAVCHHGRPYSVGHRTPDNRIWKPTGELDPFEGLAVLRLRAGEWFPEAWEEGQASSSPAPFQHAFSGLVMLADWLGSDRDRFFPFTEEGDGDRIVFARRRAVEAIRWIGLEAHSARKALGTVVPGFHHVAPRTHVPRPMQQGMLNLALPRGATLTILESETGSGKTEAVLARFLRLFHAGLVDGLYFALPTRSAATQIHRRVVEAVARAWPEGESRPPVVLAVPGYIRVDDQDARRLPAFEVLWQDSPSGRDRHRRWAAEHPKRYFAGAVVVGTVDQALLSGLQVSHAHLRSTALLRLLLVVDEVHASDAYMTAILQRVLEHHLAAQGHALLLSATLGAGARQHLLRGTGWPVELPSLDEAITMPYPAITVAQEEVQVIPVSSAGEAKQVRAELVPWMVEAATVARHALEAARRGARVLILRNTVHAAIETQELLEAAAVEGGSTGSLFHVAGVCAPHHSRFAPEDRKLLDLAVEATFGKGGTDGLVVVATQTVEQSLDLDADLLMTDLCPMDVLLQRIGRLFRHADRCRPAGFEQAKVIVLTPESRNLGDLLGPLGRQKILPRYGLKSVYTDLRVLEATWRALEEHPEFEIPRQNRLLVESATHPKALEAIARDLGGAWLDHEREVLGTYFAETGVARLNILDRTVPFGEAAFPAAELAREIRTRLGEDDRLALFDPPQPGPFGASVRQIKIPAHLARGVPSAAEPIEVEVTGDELSFSLGELRYRYDRWGLRRVTEQENEHD